MAQRPRDASVGTQGGEAPVTFDTGEAEACVANRAGFKPDDLYEEAFDFRRVKIGPSISTTIKLDGNETCLSWGSGHVPLQRHQTQLYSEPV